MTQLLLVGNAKGGTISALRVSETGFTDPVQNLVGEGCSTFAVAGNQDLVFVGVKDPTPAIVTLRLEPETGRLTELGRREVEDALAYVALTPAEDALLVASYDGGWGAIHPLAGGEVLEPTARLQHANLHAVVPSRDGRFAYFASLGDDLIAPVRLSGTGFEVIETVSCPPGSGPRHLVLSEDERSLYLLTEFTGETIRFDRDETTGDLEQAEAVAAYDTTRGLKTSEYGADPRANHLIWGADLHLVSGGRYLFATERTESTLTGIRVDDAGHLGDVVSITDTEEQPRGFVATPDGGHLVVVGERSGHATLYRVSDAGGLVEIDRVATGDGPNWARFAR